MSLRPRFRPLSPLCCLLWLGLGGVATAASATPLRVGVEVNTPPLSFVDARNQPTGFAAELLREVARAGPLDLEIVPGSWTQILADFNAGRLDVLANVTITEARRPTMDFSIGHAFTHGVVYSRPDRPSIRQSADLAGKRIATLQGSIGHLNALAHQGWGGTVMPCESWQAALDATQRGDCDVALFIGHIATKITDTYDLRREFVDDIIHQFHFAVHKGDSETLARLNEALATVRHNGAFDRLYAKWIGPIEPHPIRLADLRPYFLPGAALLLGVGLIIWWQRHVLARLSRQARALQQSEERWKFAVEGSRDGMWDWNIPAGTVLRSPRWKEMLGFADHEIGHGSAEWRDRVHPDDLPGAIAVLQDHLDQKTAAYAHEHRVRCKNGQWKWILDRGLVVSRDEQGKPLRVIGTATDISERKAAEAAIRQLNVDLEERVAGRTAELAARVAEVERLNAELEAFSYSVSHDLRTPLRNITGFIELLTGRSAGRLDPESTRYVETVTREANRLGTLIDELLEFSRVGRTELKLGRVPLDELVAEIRVELQPAVAGRAIEWRVGALPALEADRALLRQVVANLLSNAVKFTRHRQPAIIEIGTLATAPAADGLVTIFVRDNGAGFNPKYAAKLFGVFQRLHNQRDFEGTGIGLANVKRIITRHGGKVWAEGSVDKGATFYFTLKPHPV